MSNTKFHITCIQYRIIPVLFILLCGMKLIAQVESPRYRVYFSDKEATTYSLDQPQEFLSEKAIQRRAIEGIPVTEMDLPVPKSYQRQIKKWGGRVITTSKWFNTAIIEVVDTSMLFAIDSLPFIYNVKQVYFPNLEKKARDKFAIEKAEYNDVPVPDSRYGFAHKQIAIHNGQWLHKKGYDGEGTTIAVIDAGFYNVNTLTIFDSLWINQRILGVRDFVNPGNNVFNESTHGMKVLSIIGGNLPDTYIGTAPKASFWLLRSEDVHSEFIVEEDYWVAAAEFADSAGVDVINTSLGYSLFDKPAQNHTYADMDGESTIISIAAGIAASKGITLALSAGNAGASAWGYITAPADAFNVLTVGAINTEGELANFSSRGPTYDDRIKPEVVATGWGTYIQSAASPSEIVRGNGTSFAAPVIAGLTACLQQAFPTKTNSEIMMAIVNAGSSYLTPDTAYGYSVPNYQLAFDILDYSLGDKQSIEVFLYPNPVEDELYIKLLTPTGTNEVSIDIYSLSGQKVSTENFSIPGAFPLAHFPLNISQLANGIYLVQVNTGNQSVTKKIIKSTYGY